MRTSRQRIYTPCYSLLLVYLAWCAQVALADRNVTIAASDTSINYLPTPAWQVRTGQSDNIGDGTARFTTQNGASATLVFEGTAIYFQTVRATSHGVATITLDGSDFSIDSSGTPGNSDTGVVWGIVSLKDGQHKISVTQSQTTGVELSINAFIYTASGSDPDDGPDANSSEPAPLSPGNQHFMRNTALISVEAGLAAFCLGLLAFYLLRRSKNQKNAKPGVALDYTPTTPMSLHKTSFHQGVQFPQSNNLPDDHTKNLYLPELSQSAASLPGAVDLNDPDALRRARMLHPLITSTDQYTGPDTASSSTTSLRPMLPAGQPSAQTIRDQPAPRDDAASERLSVARASSWDGRTPVAGPSSGEDRIRGSPDTAKSSDLTRRLRAAASVASSRFPAGFTVIRAPSPPPAYIERMTGNFSSSSSSAGRSLPRDGVAKGSSTL